MLINNLVLSFHATFNVRWKIYVCVLASAYSSFATVMRFRIFVLWNVWCLHCCYFCAVHFSQNNNQNPTGWVCEVCFFFSSSFQRRRFARYAEPTHIDRCADTSTHAFTQALAGILHRRQDGRSDVAIAMAIGAVKIWRCFQWHKERTMFVTIQSFSSFFLRSHSFAGSVVCFAFLFVLRFFFLFFALHSLVLFFFTSLLLSISLSLCRSLNKFKWLN